MIDYHQDRSPELYRRPCVPIPVLGINVTLSLSTFVASHSFTMKILLPVAVWFLFASNVYGQFQNVTDSMRYETSDDRRRIMLGYIESKSAMFSDKKLSWKFLKAIDDFAVQHHDEALRKEVAFIRFKEAEVFRHPRAQWEGIFEGLLEKYQNQGNKLLQGYCYHEIGQLQFAREAYDDALTNVLRGLQLFQEIGYRKVPNIGKVLHEISLIYFHFEAYDKILELSLASLKLPAYSPELDIQRHNNLAIVYVKLTDYQRSKFHYLKAYEKAVSHGSKVWQGLSSGNLARLYRREKKFDSAYVYAARSYNFHQQDTLHVVALFTSIIHLAHDALELDSIKQATTLLDQAHRLVSVRKARFTGDLQQLEKSTVHYYNIRKNYYNRLGDYEKALLYNDSLLRAEEILHAKFSPGTVNVTKNKMEIEDADKALAQLRAQSLQERVGYGLLLAGLLCAGAFVYHRLHKSGQQKKMQSMALLSRTREALHQKQQAEEELLSAKTELHHFISRVNQYQAEQAAEPSAVNDTSKAMADTIDLQEVKILTDDDWIRFQRSFDKVFPHFKRDIKQVAPRIPASELRYLMLIKLDFTHKEMALALGVSDSAVRVTWNRVRKRLDGTLEDNPETLLKRVLQQDTV